MKRIDMLYDVLRKGLFCDIWDRIELIDAGRNSELKTIRQSVDIIEEWFKYHPDCVFPEDNWLDKLRILKVIKVNERKGRSFEWIVNHVSREVQSYREPGDGLLRA